MKEDQDALQHTYRRDYRRGGGEERRREGGQKYLCENLELNVYFLFIHREKWNSVLITNRDGDHYLYIKLLV